MAYHFYIMGDADKITQVLCNLIGNAINYTGADKKIIVRQSLHEHHVRVDVIDSGEGIAAQDIPYVWDRYYKGDKARKRLVSGTGLGLFIVQKILELHGATYGVKSKPGMGQISGSPLKSWKNRKDRRNVPSVFFASILFRP